MYCNKRKGFFPFLFLLNFFFVIYDFWNKSLVSNIIDKNSWICLSLFSRAVLLTPVIEQAALKTRKLFLYQLLHISLDVNLLSLCVTYILSLYYVCHFFSWIISRSLTSQIITINTKSDNVIVEDWSIARLICFFYERRVEQKRDSWVFLPTSWAF